MPHLPPIVCKDFWGLPADTLGELLDVHNAADPAGGWAYWLAREEDFLALVATYERLLLALDQASDAPGPWAGHNPVVWAERPPVPSEAIGLAAQAVNLCIDLDGTNTVPVAGPCHPTFGQPNWLQVQPTYDVPSIEKAGDILLRIRNALDR